MKMNLIGEEIQVDGIVEVGSILIHNNLLIKRKNHEADYTLRVFDLEDFS
jgi:hypothetical protein